MELTPFLFGLYKFAKYGLYPVSWIAVLLAAAFALQFFPPNAKRLRLAKWMTGSALLVLMIFTNPLVAQQLLGHLEAAASDAAQSSPLEPEKHFSAIVVLSGGINAKGTLRPHDEISFSSLQRTICGVDLYHAGMATQLVFSGGDATIIGSGPPESEPMAALAAKLGVPAHAILKETTSRNTYENAVMAKKLLGSRSVLLVTSASHILRATAIFRKQGLDVTPFPCGYVVADRPEDSWDIDPFSFMPSVNALRHNTAAIEEAFGFGIYRLLGKL